MNPSSPSDSLRGALRRWQVAPPADPAFRPAVWSRIESARRVLGETWSAYFRRHALGWSLTMAIALGGAILLGQRAGVRRALAEHDVVLHTYLAQIDARAMHP